MDSNFPNTLTQSQTQLGATTANSAWFPPNRVTNRPSKQTYPLELSLSPPTIHSNSLLQNSSQNHNNHFNSQESIPNSQPINPQNIQKNNENTNSSNEVQKICKTALTEILTSLIPIILKLFFSDTPASKIESIKEMVKSSTWKIESIKLCDLNVTAITRNFNIKNVNPTMEH